MKYGLSNTCDLYHGVEIIGICNYNQHLLLTPISGIASSSTIRCDMGSGVSSYRDFEVGREAMCPKLNSGILAFQILFANLLTFYIKYQAKVNHMDWLYIVSH